MVDERRMDALLRAANPVQDDDKAMRVVRAADPLWQTIRTRLDRETPADDVHLRDLTDVAGEEPVMTTKTRSTWMVAAAAVIAVALGVVATVATSSPRGRDAAGVASGAAADQEDAAADATVTFDGTECTSTLPERWPQAAPLRLHLRNTSGTAFSFDVGTYDEGYDRDDMLEHPLGSRPHWARANVVFQTSVFAGEPTTVTVLDAYTGDHLEAGRYYVVCFQTGVGPIVLPDLILE